MIGLWVLCRRFSQLDLCIWVYHGKAYILKNGHNKIGHVFMMRLAFIRDPCLEYKHHFKFSCLKLYTIWSTHVIMKRDRTSSLWHLINPTTQLQFHSHLSSPTSLFISLAFAPFSSLLVEGSQTIQTQGCYFELDPKKVFPNSIKHVQQQTTIESLIFFLQEGSEMKVISSLWNTIHIAPSLDTGLQGPTQ